MKRLVLVSLTGGVLLAAAVAVLAGAASNTNGQGKGNGNGGGGSAPTTTDYPVKVTFLDRSEDGISSDGKVYQNGVDGVSAVFNGSNLLLQFGKVKGQYPRTVHYDYTHPVATSCDGNVADNPVGTANSYNYVDVLNITTMTVGQTLAKQGGFRTLSNGTFRFHDVTKLDPLQPYHCADLLVVTRVSTTTWTVTTDTTPGQTYYTTAGNPVYPANPEEVGSIAQLDIDNTGYTLIGNYRMPFFMTISCLSASSCPK